MQVHQILIRPIEETVIVLYTDLAGRKESLSLDGGNVPEVSALVAYCQQRLPSDANHPAKAEIEKEIVQLEERVEQLKKSIGIA